MKNYKQRYEQITRQLQNVQLDDWERHSLEQTLHYIETEYAYRPRCKHHGSRPRCKDSGSTAKSKQNKS